MEFHVAVQPSPTSRAVLASLAPKIASIAIHTLVWIASVLIIFLPAAVLNAHQTVFLALTPSVSLACLNTF
jgi:hypothetical protein